MYCIFPHSKNYKWNLRNFGPLIIPGKNQTITLSTKNISIYKRIIEIYENNTLKIIKNKIFVNGKLTKKYTFKQNYYFVFGDKFNFILNDEVSKLEKIKLVDLKRFYFENENKFVPNNENESLHAV